MTTITVNTQQEVVAAFVLLTLAAAFTLSVALGWIRFSVSIGAIPPWNRRAAVRKTSVPAPAVSPGEGAETTGAGAAPTPVRRAS